MAQVELQTIELPPVIQAVSHAPVPFTSDVPGTLGSNAEAQGKEINASHNIDPLPAPGLPEEPPTSRHLSRLRASFIILSVAGITILNCFSQAILTVAIPRIAADLHIPSSQIQWPAAIASLTLGCTLLVVGAIADVVGNRLVFLAGCLLHLGFGLGCSLSQTGGELIAFRALQGLALSLCMPTSIGIITSNFEAGRGRNLAFACFGGGNPFGYAIGLLLEGIFVDTVGWRWGFYLLIGLNAMILVAAFFALPVDTSGRASVERLRIGVDWIGLFIISAALAMLSYVLGAITSTSTLSPRQPADIVILTLALLLFPCFAVWEGRQERSGRPALIPNSIWQTTGFTSVCLATFLTWAMFNSVTFNATLLMQEIQHVSALGTSLRFLPVVILGVFSNLLAGYLVDKVAASTLLFATTVLSAVPPLLFAVLNPDWSYWAAMFPAMFLLATSSDFLFSISNLVITSTFSTADQALAGGIFSTVSQLGNSIGLAVTSAIAGSVTAKAEHAHGTTPDAMLPGYRAAFWTSFAAAVASGLIGTLGLRKSGKVGLKRE